MISEKLLEFNRNKTGGGVYKVQENYLEGVIKLAGADATGNSFYLHLLLMLLEWPQGEYELYLLLYMREGKQMFFFSIYIYFLSLKWFGNCLCSVELVVSEP